ncbi:MAG: UDP-glucose 6-dehydrogenase [Rhodospirillaceae bacterium]|nr:UDP-glucose 6-dehydrogenase [Rhodospirillaceae bacterium]
MRVVMVGTGYVGLVSGACFSEFGVDVICVDKNTEKVERLNNGDMPIFEPGLENLVRTNANAGRLSFSTDLKTSVAQADVVFIAVGTPACAQSGRADLSFVESAAAEIAEAVSGFTVVVNKSTVPVGTAKEVAGIFRAMRPDADVEVVSNPEFLREGSAINDFMRPDRVVIGSNSERARDVMRQLYRVLYLIETPIIFTTPETSELIKYSANAFLATKISFINEISDLCEKVGADVHDVAKGIGLDGRIGRKFLHAGPGYGGSCFPKDTVALVQTASDYGSPLNIVDTVIDVNRSRKLAMADKVIDGVGGSVDGKVIAILGLTFKPNTDDMRESPALDIISKLVSKGATVRVFDPGGMQQAKILMPELVYCEDEYDAMLGANALAIVTEWNQFRNLDLVRVKSLLSDPVIIDYRNIYSPNDMYRAGFKYTCIGRPNIDI